MTLSIFKKLLLGFLFIPTVALSQEEQQEKDWSYDAFIGVRGGIAMVHDEVGTNFNMRGGMMITEHLGIGATMNVIQSDCNDCFSYDGNEYKATIRSFYGGLYLEPFIKQTDRFQLSIPIIIGGGEMSHGAYKPSVASEQNPNGSSSSSDNFVLVEPGVEVGFTLHKHIELGLGASYRLINTGFEITQQIDGAQHVLMDSNDAEGFNVYLSLKFRMHK